MLRAKAGAMVADSSTTVLRAARARVETRLVSVCQKASASAGFSVREAGQSPAT